MPQIGPLELVIVLVIALLVLGPGRLPDVGAALGKSIREFRKATSEVQEATKIDVSPLPPTSSATPAPSAAPVSAPVATPVGAAPTPSSQPPTEPQA
jgi:sec-independent protein translocase protein TatA